MADNSNAPERTIYNPMLAFVKGGTSTSANDARLEQEFLDAERRRDIADREKALSEIPIEKGGAMMNTCDLRGPQGASYLPLRYINRFGDEYSRGCGDLILGTLDDPMDMLVILVCPKCAVRKPHLQDCQIQVLKSNKNFEFVPHEGKFFVFDDGDGKVRYRSAGVLKASEKFTCPHCSWTARFDNNRVIED